MRVRFWIYILLFTLSFKNSGAQEYIYVSASGLAKLTRVEFGYSQWSLTPKDSTIRLAHGLTLQEQIKTISGFYDQKMEKALAIHDALYFKLNFGKMVSAPHYSHSFYGETEKKFSTLTEFGYFLCAGYKTKKWSIMLGPDIKFTRTSVGGISFPGLDPLFYRTISFMIRGEFVINKNNLSNRSALVFWTNLKRLSDSSTISNYSGLIEIPFSKNGRYKFMAQYTLMGGKSNDNFRSLKPIFSKMTEIRVGIKVGFPP
ncbi:MAG: hypothetical protein HND27_10100 [Bacteroidetes bacterium]|jgi:hypothetical protein|nr:hypothetical protein [Bacteroidota bacterium]MBV6461396.1 hypothetical protein [Flavobacteriales bacterium]WKZ75203.1 MAG: hypothetical protein QY303_13765 [Vicingaceae bacterium]MCL4817426.1 hypothetical protein [Flavobacteriales bacterium]NOG96113.1 hypothetical protein [Bacteroidota bacterium]